MFFIWNKPSIYRVYQKEVDNLEPENFTNIFRPISLLSIFFKFLKKSCIIALLISWIFMNLNFSILSNMDFEKIIPQSLHLSTWWIKLLDPLSNRSWSTYHIEVVLSLISLLLLTHSKTSCDNFALLIRLAAPEGDFLGGGAFCISRVFWVSQTRHSIAGSRCNDLAKIRCLLSRSLRGLGDILVTFYGELLFLDFCNFVFFRIFNLTLILTGEPNPYSNLNNPNPNLNPLKDTIDTAEVALTKLQHLVYTRKISQLVNWQDMFATGL